MQHEIYSAVFHKHLDWILKRAGQYIDNTDLSNLSIFEDLMFSL